MMCHTSYLTLRRSAHVIAMQDDQKRQAKQVHDRLDALLFSDGKRNTSSRYNAALTSAIEPGDVETRGMTLGFVTNLLSSFHDSEIQDKESLMARQILDSLYFRDLNARQNAIPKAYEETFNWIFESSSHHGTGYRWSNFTQWLQSDEKLYWIAGKPGAGKSTLMKYLFDRPKTSELVASWLQKSECNRSYHVVRAGFFFWSAGSEIQRSRIGFARSMITQIWNSIWIESEIKIDVAQLFPARWKRYELLDTNDEDFTWEELVHALDIILTTSNCLYLLFIDGLDEFQGDKDDIADLIVKLSIKPSVKICAASRPWVEFQSKLDQAPQLLMEMLTRRDMVDYINGQFTNSSEFQLMERFEKSSADALKDGIIMKASGVFLWVYVVVRTLLAGLRDGDRIKSLLDKLDSLPPELDQLFDNILRQQLSPEHRKEASELFQFMRANPSDATLLGLYWSQSTLKETLDAEIRALSHDEAAYHCTRMRRFLSSRCKCLLDPGESTRYNVRVEWLHRTAKEYVEKEDVWADIVSQSPDYKPVVALNLSLLQQVKAGIISELSGTISANEALSRCVHLAKVNTSLEDEMMLLDDIDRTGRTLLLGEAANNFSVNDYWLNPGQMHVPGAKLQSLLKGKTTIFHVAMLLNWRIYVQHRVLMDPAVIHTPMSTGLPLEGLLVAAAFERWEMICLCLENGAAPHRVCNYDVTKVARMDVGKARNGKHAWQTTLERIDEHLTGRKSEPSPWAAMVHASATFLKYGATPSLSWEAFNSEKIMARLIARSKGLALEEDIATIRSKCPRNLEKLLSWRKY